MLIQTADVLEKLFSQASAVFYNWQRVRNEISFHFDRANQLDSRKDFLPTLFVDILYLTPNKTHAILRLERRTDEALLT